jgi:Flp pilus assembly protein TadG
VMPQRGQALVELAVCLPVILLLGLGAVGVVQVADAASGLQAATEAAVSAASRAADEQQALSAADRRFVIVLAAYPLRSAHLVITDSGFARGSLITGTATAAVDLSWESMSFLPVAPRLSATASMRVEPWRTHL